MLAVAILAGGAAVRADIIIVSNLGGSDNGFFNVQPGQWFAREFTTGSQAYDLTSIVATLSNSIGDDTLFVAKLNSDGGGHPSNSTLTTLAPSPFPVGSSNTDVTFTPQTAVTLSPGTNYWFELGYSSGGGSTHWHDTFGSSTTGPGTLSPGIARSFDQGASWTPAGGNAFIQVNGNPMSAVVPEPSTLAMLGTAAATLLGFGYGRRAHWK